ncbi:ubiquitin carboxyl-terminal hydrolase 21-like [Phoenix dactylifera]|uniref:Ubiquitin carboxyl-terminal hydrolase 21-like n=1 Tax=Phoenix dactylifera TaxID=42345 RepID=A0A8B7CCF6_PHODC|nr:ubiquitin carboxyl-terminal hydrolase 21-like [Phoenix dactylifera]
MEAESLHPPPPQTESDPGNMERSWLSPPPSNYQPRLVGAALWNLGNTCFLNAVLQCLTHTVPLIQKLRSVDHSSTCCGGNGDFCSFCALREHINLSIVKSGNVISPRRIADNMSKISSCFQLGNQGDAHEFLHALLDSLHGCCLDPILKDHPSSLEKDSLVKQVFGGRLRSQLRCCDCGHCSDTFEPLLDLSLEIGDVDTLTDALVSFTKVEKLDDPEAKFTCEGCKAQVLVEKQLKLDQAPEIVALQLKRFKSIGFFATKIEKFVEYPLELDLNPFLSCPEDGAQLKYDLYAVLVHDGSPYSGHYYCFVRSSPTAWFQMNDSEVARVSETHVLKESAFILFYIKQGSSPWFSTLMEAQKVPDLDGSNDASPVSVLDYVDRNLVSPSIGETSCSSSREMQGKDEDPSQCFNFSPVVDEERCHDATPSACYHRSLDEGSCKAMPDKLNIVGIFQDEPLEDEKENHLIPQFQGELKLTREVGKPTLNTMKDVPMNEPLKRLVRGMPGSRRSSILACLATQHKPLHRRPLQDKGQLPSNKRMRASLDGSSREATAAAQLTSASRQSLSPRSIRRGLFIDDSELDLELVSRQSE